MAPANKQRQQTREREEDAIHHPEGKARFQHAAGLVEIHMEPIDRHAA